jgi:hypothetical protein
MYHVLSFFTNDHQNKAKSTPYSLLGLQDAGFSRSRRGKILSGLSGILPMRCASSTAQQRLVGTATDLQDAGFSLSRSGKVPESKATANIIVAAG